MHILQRVSLFFCLLSVGLPACKKDDSKPDPAAPTTPAARNPVAAAPPTTAHAPTGGDVKSGKVLETMASGGYTYAKLDTGGAEIWVAGPETALTVGQQISASGGSLMRNFHSKTLDRSFTEIYFVTTLTAGGAATKPDPHAGSAPVAEVAANVEAVEPASGGKTVADLFAEKDALNGKPVVVRGKVVKFNAGIMGRNWIHLQDGSGAAGTSDLTVTTEATATVGDIVTIRGTVATDRDFGSGYNYAVIVENATVDTK